ncbi:hypothetical protein [Streptomyces fagopyri]|uniref:hypothetical protein n=1 Tax=Streptomyces fagopyri TaxID=2662397 RepID=UPI0037FBAD89
METAQALCADLYYPGCLSLERKQAAADSLASWSRPADMRAAYSKRRWNEREDRILPEHNHPTSAAEALSRTIQRCSLRLWRLRSGRVPMPAGDK